MHAAPQGCLRRPVVCCAVLRGGYRFGAATILTVAVAAAHHPQLVAVRDKGAAKAGRRRRARRLWHGALPRRHVEHCTAQQGTAWHSAARGGYMSIGQVQLRGGPGQHAHMVPRQSLVGEQQPQVQGASPSLRPPAVPCSGAPTPAHLPAWPCSPSERCPRRRRPCGRPPTHTRSGSHGPRSYQVRSGAT